MIVMARLIMRKATDGGPRNRMHRTMIGGVLLEDLCADGHERVVDARITLDRIGTYRIVEPERVAGAELSALMTDVLGREFPNKQWTREDVRDWWDV